MAWGRRAACLLVTNLFPPALGGSSEVYAALASFARGEIAVLTASHDYETGLERQAWPAFDQRAAYPITRVKSIRPFVRSLYPSSGRYRLHEACTALKLIAAVLHLVVRHNVRTICIADDETVGWLTLVGKLLGLRTLIYCHGDDLHCSNDDVPRRSRWFNLADKVVAANRYAQDLLAERFGVPLENTVLIQNGVDLAAFYPTSPPDFLMRRHNLYGRRVLLSVTRLVSRKGVDMVLEALSEVAGHFPNVIYLIVRDGPQRAELQSIAEQLGIMDLVTFVGPVHHHETRDYYNTAEVVLLCNREDHEDSDGLPLIFLEVNACEKPVIGGRAGGTSEVIRDGKNGVIVDGRNSREIAGVICQLLSDEARRREMGREGLRMAGIWEWSAQTKLFIATYKGRTSL